MKTAVLYFRVSSQEQKREGFSIPAQRKLLQEYAKREGFQIIAEFEDVESAKQSGRIQFKKMIAFLKKNPSCKHLLVEKTDRLYRNFKDLVVVDDLPLVLHFVKEGVTLSPDSRSSKKFMH